MKTNRCVKPLLFTISLAVCVLAPPANAEKILLKGGGDTIEGVALRYKKTTDEYIITRSDGRQLTFQRSRVERIEVAKPPRWETAMQALNMRDVPTAINHLESIVQEYDGLGWDTRARDMLGKIYLQKKDFQKAYEAYEALFKSALGTEITSDMQKRYSEALVGSGRTGRLMKEMDDMIAKGTRNNAASALITRGDIYKRQQKYADALYDYLRVVILFEQVKEVQAEALCKTAQCLQELKDPRADQFKRKLLADYAQTPWAQEVNK